MAEEHPGGLLETAAVALVVFDQGGRRIEASYGDASLLTDLRPQPVPAAQDPLRRALQAAQARPGGSATVQVDGKVIELHYEPRSEGRSPFLLAVDVTAHVRRMEESVQRERQMTVMSRQLPAIAWATDRDLRITHLLGRVPREIGIDSRTIIGGSLHDLAGTHDANDPAIAHHLAALLGQAGLFRYPFRGRWYEVHVAPLRDEHDDVITGCVGTAVDITQRKESEDRTLAIHSALVESQRLAHVGNWEWDIQRDRVCWSDELFRIYGIGRSCPFT